MEPEPEKKRKRRATGPTFEPIDPRVAEDNLTMEYEREKLEKLLPELSREMFGGEGQSISFTDALKEVDEESGEPIDAEENGGVVPVDTKELSNPDAVSFIRRCSTAEEAFEIITYLETRGELSPEDADEYRVQLHSSGLESFGPRKEPGYYERAFPRRIRPRNDFLPS
ncbi:MAG TPA: DUF2095 family protein [Candidatus Lokiarchaeia archaeon]|nr:DUF2095 family protein [Candidatus Lokiarchaeia archaeon]